MKGKQWRLDCSWFGSHVRAPRAADAQLSRFVSELFRRTWTTPFCSCQKLKNGQKRRYKSSKSPHETAGRMTFVGFYFLHKPSSSEGPFQEALAWLTPHDWAELATGEQTKHNPSGTNGNIRPQIGFLNLRKRLEIWENTDFKQLNVLVH